MSKVCPIYLSMYYFYFYSSENSNPLVSNMLEISEDEACPNLMPAYSINSPCDGPDKISDFVGSDKHDLCGSKLVVLPNDSIPTLQKNICEKMEQSMFNHNSHYKKIKLESSENIVSNHVSYFKSVWNYLFLSVFIILSLKI